MKPHDKHAPGGRHDGRTTRPGAGLRGLYVITDERLAGGHLPIARAALAGGAKIIQLRDKSTPPAPLYVVACTLRAMTREAGVLLLINDNVELAQKVEADGVHLGPDDMSVSDARRQLGGDGLIGASCGTIAEAMAASAAGADYIGVGPIFGTATKADAGPAIGLQALAAIAASTPLPVAAIGGINGAAIASVLSAGAVMACVVSAVAAAGDEAAMTQAVRALVQSCRQ